MRPRACGALVALLSAAGLVAATPAGAQKPVGVGTNPAGTAFYAIGSAVAKVVSDAGTVKAAVQPYTGSSTFLPLINSGELEFGVNNAVDMVLAHRGPGFKIGGRNPFPHTPNARLALRLTPLQVGLLVRKDSPIKSVHDVRGKRMTGEYPAHLAVWYNMFGHLSSAGLSWSDVTVVPVPAVNDGVNAVVQGRADVTEHAIGSAKVKEADAAVGVRHVSIDCSPAGEQRLRAAVPGYYPVHLKAGSATAVVEDTCVIGYDIYLITGASVPGQLVEAVLKAVWEHPDRLAQTHPGLKTWKREHGAHPDVTIPYHEAAVRFFKSQGVWTPELDATQKKLSALNP
jgi:TRAP transporter TAXI family solute receptor